MQHVFGQEQLPAPAVRVFVLGECALERRVDIAGHEPRYERVPPTEWQGRGPALALLKLLVCRLHRRATKDDVVAMLWSGAHLKNVGRACDAAASVLRRVLGTPDGSSLLLTSHRGSNTTYRLANQQHLWVDADACDACVEQAIQAEGLGSMQESLAWWEEASRLLKRGVFLEEDVLEEWTRERRQVVEGNQRLCVHHLADWYLVDHRREEAETLLRSFWTMHPTDEDALLRLLTLLAQQGRSLEALRLVAHTERLLAHESGASLSAKTLALAEQLRRQGSS
jgi:DNA-binding SARP family transcriptional activator